MTRKGRNDAACVLAEAVRAACIETAVLAYEDAGLRGLCQEGRWEHALAAIRRLQRAIDFVIRDGTQEMIGCAQRCRCPDKDTI